MASAINEADTEKQEAGSAGDGISAMVRQRMDDGTELVQNSDGSVLQRNPDGSTILKMADGTIVQRSADGVETCVISKEARERERSVSRPHGVLCPCPLAAVCL